MMATTVIVLAQPFKDAVQGLSYEEEDTCMSYCFSPDLQGCCSRSQSAQVQGLKRLMFRGQRSALADLRLKSHHVYIEEKFSNATNIGELWCLPCTDMCEFCLYVN